MIVAKKQMQDDQRYKYRLMLVMKWDIIKEKKKGFMEIAVERNRKRTIAERWIKNIITYL